ncbi:MAG: peptide ABC transporter substrate-binding protein [Holophaga sp.]|nr:peptide ABC transporter substrate-binding protein [Holophaga sp.]
MNTRLASVLLSFGLFASLAAAPQKITYALNGEAQTLDPNLNQWFRASIVLKTMFTGLEKLDPDGRPVPAMASSYKLDKSKTVYTFTIAAGAKWADGKPVTAQDFEYSWKRVVNPKTAAPSSFYLYYVKNGKAIVEGKAPVDQLGVQALNPRTLKVTLENPTPYFLDLLCVTAYMPVRRDLVEGSESWTKNLKTYVGNGPFQMVEYKPRQKYVLKKNPNYLDAAKVKLDTLEIVIMEAQEAQLAAYQTGEIQVFDDPSAEGLKKYQGTRELNAFPRIGVSYYDFNTATRPFNDPRVRRAFGIAINRAQIVKNILQTSEKPALGFVPYGISDGVKKGKAYRDVVGNPIKEDPAEARKLLAAAGYPNGKGFPKVTLICQSNQQAKDVCQAFQAMWKSNLGVTVDIQSFETKVYWTQLHSGNFNIAADSWSGDYSDPMTNLEIFQTNQNVQNNRWTNRAYDALIEANHKSADQKLRMANFVTAEKILANDMPVMPAYYYLGRVLCKPNIKGVMKTYLGHTCFEYAHVE